MTKDYMKFRNAIKKNEEKPTDKVILDFLSQHYNRSGTIKEILYDLITNNQVPSKYLVSTKEQFQQVSFRLNIITILLNLVTWIIIGMK